MPLTIATSQIAQVVKNKTASLHQEVEHILLPKLQTIRSFEDYVLILRMFYGFFHPLEEKIHAYISSEVLPDIAQRRTSSLIITDLDNLQLHVPLTICKHLPEINSTATAFGALYVLEGSTLGGKMIAKMLAKSDGPAIPAEALHFFSGYQQFTGKMWTSFVEALNKQTDTDVIVHSANQTFYHLKHWMQQELSHEAENKF